MSSKRKKAAGNESSRRLSTFVAQPFKPTLQIPMNTEDSNTTGQTQLALGGPATRTLTEAPVETTPATENAQAGPALVRSGASVPAAPDEAEVTLKDGRVARVILGKGRHVMEARRFADGDESKMSFALVAVCTTINGAGVIPEDLLEMDMPDFLAIENAFNIKNGFLG